VRVVHLANSAAALGAGARTTTLGDGVARPDVEVWVRPGLSLFGVTPFPDGDRADAVDVAFTWRAPIVTRKRVPTGTPVSYGSTFITTRPTEIAVLGLGYADGYPRALSGKGELSLAGMRVPVLGRVCMDLTMVDVTDVVAAHGEGAAAIGTDVVVLGGRGADAIDPWEMALRADTIAYEMLTSIAARVPRVVARAADVDDDDDDEDEDA
jgi:alanine racemase